MTQAETNLKIARWAWPGAWREGPWKGAVQIEVEGKWQDFDPPTCLNDCALVEAVIRGRGLMDDYRLLIFAHTKCDFDLSNENLLIVTPAPTRAAAMEALIDQLNGEKE